MFVFFGKIAAKWAAFKTKLPEWTVVRKWLIVLLVIALVVFIYVRERQHKAEVAKLQSQITETTDTTTTKTPTVAVTTNSDANGNPTASAISSAGDLSANMSNDFYKQVSKNKSKSLYSYDFNGTPDEAIASVQAGISSGTAQKEVKNADFVTITQGDTTSTTVLTPAQVAAEAAAPAKTDTSTATAATDSGGVTTNTTTVKVNAYYNYKPSVYYMPQAYPDTLKRHDIVYVNRDVMVDVNYDADRSGSKVGASIGYRIKSW